MKTLSRIPVCSLNIWYEKIPFLRLKKLMLAASSRDLHPLEKKERKDIEP